MSHKKFKHHQRDRRKVPSQQRSVSLSLSMIVKNEEKYLEGCLDSVKDVVSEIVVVDTGSTDRTVEIAQGYGAKVFSFEWINDFAAARNEALRHCTGEWVLYLDADERLRPEQHDVLRTMLRSNSASGTDAFYLKLRSPIGSLESAQVHLVPYPRLFRNRPGLKFEGRIHEQITPALSRRGARFKDSPIIIDHLGYAREQDVIEAKTERNLQMLLSQVNDEPNNGYAHYQLGQTYLVRKDVENGLPHLKRALDSVNGISYPIRAAIHAIFAGQCLEKGLLDDTVTECKRSLEYAPNQTYAHMLLATVSFRQEDYAAAAAELKTVLDFLHLPDSKRKTDVATDAVYPEHVILHKLGTCYSRLGELAKATACFEKALTLKSDFPDVLFEFGACKSKQGDMTAATELLERAHSLLSDNTTVMMTLAGLYEELGRKADAAALLEKVVVVEPENTKAHFFLGTYYGETSAIEKAIQEFGLKKAQWMSGQIASRIDKLAQQKPRHRRQPAKAGGQQEHLGAGHPIGLTHSSGQNQ
jgi:tetratricopeptide (TPR) repeat protein